MGKTSPREKFKISTNGGKNRGAGFFNFLFKSHNYLTLLAVGIYIFVSEYSTDFLCITICWHIWLGSSNLQPFVQVEMASQFQKEIKSQEHCNN